MQDDKNIIRKEAPEDQAPVHGRLPRNLTIRERKIELGAQEKIIERNLDAYLRVGEALGIIRAQRLYRGMVINGTEIMTFPQYCQVRWGWDGARGRQLIAAAHAAEVLKRETGIAATNENQLRPLVKLVRESPQRAGQVWRQAHEYRPATERTVRAVLKQGEVQPAEAQVTAVDLMALIEQVKITVRALIVTMDESEYHAGLSAERRQAIKVATRSAMLAMRDLLSQI